ncbi:MAG: substrate-binding domain-containing protein [Phycisphaeraceae bacterium]
MAKYEQISAKLQERIQQGDYRLRGFPSHTGLVAELGVNSRTIAKALSSLIKRGVLVRDETGRIDVPAPNGTRTLHIGVLSPAWPSTSIMNWHHLIHQACGHRQWMAKPLVYSHWHDMAITEALRGMDGLFFLSIGDDFPESVLQQLQQSDTPVVILEQDLSARGLPSLRYWNPAPINKLVEHLRDRGHQRVACFNTQPDSNVIRERIAAWQLWSAAHNVRGPLINQPVPLFESAPDHAYRLVRAMIADDKLDATALLCTTADVAIGAMRGVVDSGNSRNPRRRLGADIAVCSVAEWSGMAHLLCPSLTCLRPPSMAPLVQVCLDYFDQNDKPWMGPLLIQPSSMELFVGESTTSSLTYQDSSPLNDGGINHGQPETAPPPQTSSER